jgi:vitamin B12 transporter
MYVFLLSSALFVSAASAQDTTLLPPVTVTATRIPIRLDLVSSSVTVVTAAELRRYRTVGDVLRDTPAASVIATGSFGGQTSVFLRGGESDYVKVLLDGVPLNQPGGAFDFADLSLKNVDRIEVVRGPGSVLYGSDAMTGVIQIFTRTGAGPGRVTAWTRAGTYGALETGAQLQGGAGPLAYSAEMARFSADGQLPFNNQYERSVGAARVRLTPDTRTDITVALRYADQTYHYPTDGAGRLVDSNTFRFERGPAWTVEAGYAVSPRVAVRVSYAVKQSQQGIDDRADNAGDTLGFYGFQSRDEVRRATAGARVDWRIGRSIVTFGADLDRQRQDGRSESQSQFGPFPDSLNPRRRNDALYVQTFTGLTGPLSLQAGARLDENERFGRFVTLRAGGVYRLGPDSRLRAALGTGFKEPTFFENFAQGFVIGNPDLVPERTRSWEAGLEQRFGRVTLSVAYFDQAFRNLIEYDPSAAPGEPNYRNIGQAVADGAEGEVAVALGRGWSATLRHVYLDTRVLAAGGDASFTPGERLLRRPTGQTALHLSGAVGRRAHMSLAVRHTGDRDDLDFSTFPFPRTTLGGFTHVDVAAQYEFALGSVLGLDLNARVENLFDDQARAVANYPARGRVVFLGGQVRAGR